MNLSKGEEKNITQEKDQWTCDLYIGISCALHFANGLVRLCVGFERVEFAASEFSHLAIALSGLHPSAYSVQLLLGSNVLGLQLDKHLVST